MPGCQKSPHVRESETLLDSGFHAVDSGFQSLDARSFSVELGFRIRIVSGIPDSYTCIPDSKAQDSGFHKQKFARFRIPNAKFSRIPLHVATEIFHALFAVSVKRSLLASIFGRSRVGPRLSG